MKFLELVKRRQSIRQYSSQPVPRELIDKCLEAAQFAPSACNAQPWSFIIVDDEKVKNALTNKAFSGIYSMNSFAKNASVIIVVIAEQSTYAAKLGGYFRGTQFNLIDIGIACEHLILQAAEQELGTCWLGWFNEKEVKKVLGLSKKKKVCLLISMGYPEAKFVREKKRKTLNEIRRYYSLYKINV